MSSLLRGLVASLLVLPLAGTAAEPPAPKKILVVTVTKGFRHSSIPTAEKVLAKLADQSHAFTVDYVRTDEEMAAKMTPEALKGYDGFFFANTTGILPLPDKEAFLSEVRSGKGFVGTHSASDTFHGKDQIDPYIEMLGGEFQTHGAQAGVECLVQDAKHPATRHLGESYCVQKEEMYLIINHDSSKVHELLLLDKHPNQKSKLGRYPVAWCKKYGQGNVFYTSLGHNESVWENEAYQKHLLGGIKWSLGLEPGDATPQAIAASDSRAAGVNGFRPLFNSKDLTGWKLRNPQGHNSWTIENGVLQNTVPPGTHGTDLVTTDKFWNFTVRYEYMVPDGSNSGFYLRGRHEIQILGDYQSGKPSQTGNGAIYNHTAPSEFASKPGGEWQTVEATIIDNKITVTLNGKKIHDQVECNRATGSEIDGNVKEPGPIFLQGDHGTVGFRNLEIKELK